MPISIKIENLSKVYRLGTVSTRTLSHDLNRWWTVNIRGKEDPYLKIGEGTMVRAYERTRGRGGDWETWRLCETVIYPMEASQVSGTNQKSQILP